MPERLRTDYALLQLSRDPPVGAGMSGWTSASVSVDDAVVGVHHPAGDLKKVLEAVVLGHRAWPENVRKVTHIHTQATEGVLEGGSSGSGLWKRVDGQDYLVGLLTGSEGGCNNGGKAFYGRMDLIYPRVGEWLGADAESGAERPMSSVVALALVDASNGATLMDLLEEGAVVDLDATDTRSFNIRTELSPRVAPRNVAMELSGAQAAARTSRRAPFTLYGDNAGSGLSPGDYIVSAAPTDASGEVLPSRSASFTVTGEAEASDIAVTGLTLMTSVTGQDLAVLSDGALIEVWRNEGPPLGLRADTGGTGRVGSVGFEVSGEVALSLTADTAPFAIDVELPAGTYSVVATPYPEAGRGGAAGPSTTVTGFTLERPTSPITGFTLVDAKGGPPDPDVQTIEDGSILDLAWAGGVFNIRADVIDDPPDIGSVRLELTGPKFVRRLEDSGSAYTLFGEGRGNNYRGEMLPNGDYTITATAYEESGGGGNAYLAREVQFTVTGGLAPTVSPVVGFTLVDAEGGLPDLDIAMIEEGSVLYLGLAGPRFNIRADLHADGPELGSMRLVLTGQRARTQLEPSGAPYSLFGDDGAGNYREG